MSEAGAPTLAIGPDGVARITLRRPRHLNRLHGEDLATLTAHFDRLRDDEHARVLVLTGKGRAFSTGFHLGELGPAAASAPLAFERMVDALEALPLPTVARLHGDVHGGAVDLALACDFRIGVTGMALRMPAARIGLHYYASGLRRGVARLGLQAAKRLFLLAEVLDAPTLLAMGYLDQLVAPDDLDAAVDRLSDTLAANAPLAVRGMKRALGDLAAGRDDPAAITAAQARCADSEDLREGLAALAERRPPRFEGR